MATKRANSQVLKSPSDLAGSGVSSKRATRQNMSTCKVCEKPVTLQFQGEESVSVLCRKCNDRYHANCVGISSEFVFKLIQNSRKGWLCYSCAQDSLNFMQKLEERLSIVEKQIQQNSIQVQQINSSFDAALKSLDDKIETVRQEIQESQPTSPLTTESINDIVRHVTDKVLESMNGGSGSSEADLKYVRDLQRKNNLVISNVPINNHETQITLKQQALKIAHSLGVNLQLADIAVVIRLNSKANQTSSAILVKFIDAVMKHDVFDAYIKRVINKNPITFQAIGLQSTQRIFINHHISPQLAEIKRKALELKKDGIISKVNARYNNIRVFINNKWHNVDTLPALDSLVNGVSSF